MALMKFGEADSARNLLSRAAKIFMATQNLMLVLIGEAPTDTELGKYQHAP
ncbi:MAG: hypothetical protein M5R41_19210 [Bacteroidia bacterium]|nr:hypothetical protein [Bacteroidia bacterium]